MKVYQLLVHLHLFTFYFSHTPIHEVVPNAVRIADMMLARICSDHFTTSFFVIMQFTIYEFTIYDLFPSGSKFFTIHSSLFTLSEGAFAPIA